MQKVEALRALARKRAHARPVGYKGIDEYHGGAYDCEHVSPYTKSAGNVDSPVVFVLQDWSSDTFLHRPLREDVVALGYSPELPTNKNLIRLIREHFGLELADVYVTNLFPFVKPGGISNTIPLPLLAWSATEFLLPQIRIVRPKVVVTFGVDTFNAVSRSVGHDEVPRLAEGIARPIQIDDAVIWCQSHPGGLGRANRNRGGVDRVSEDWRAMCRSFDGLLWQSAA